MNYAIILSSGVGTRMKSDIPKQYIDYKGTPIIIDTLHQFQICHSVDRIIVVCADAWMNKVQEWCREYGISKLDTTVKGGKSRQESILNGLKYCIGGSNSDNDKVIIHDAVRPFVTIETIELCLDVLNKYDGVMPVLPVKDTIYQCADGNTISSLLDRDTLFAGQSPEGFLLHKYYAIHRDLSASQLSAIKGSSEIAFRYGMSVKIIEGDEGNFKITTPMDLKKYIEIKEKNHESI